MHIPPMSLEAQMASNPMIFTILDQPEKSDPCLENVLKLILFLYFGWTILKDLVL